jgi:hypothetical protein
MPCYCHCSLQGLKSKQKVIFKHTESYVKKYLAKGEEEIHLKQTAPTASDFYVLSQSKVYFVIHICGINKIAPKP